MANKILSIVPYAILPYQSGGQKSIALFNEYLGQTCELTVIGTRGNDVQLASNYQLLPWMKDGSIKFFDVFLLFKLIPYIRKNNIDTVIMEHPYLGWMGYVLRKTTRIKWVVHTHNIEFERFKQLGKKWWPILKMYETWVLKKADTIFCISAEDKLYMETQLGLPSNKCNVVPFGIEQDGIPADKDACRNWLLQQHQIAEENNILLFNGALNYAPNLVALEAILNHINPLLLQQPLKYIILICGRGLPKEYNNLAAYQHQNIRYAGFVENIEVYFKGADLFLNPITFGGGVKTKLIEALGCNTTVISTVNGAIGCDTSTCRNKLVIVPDANWEAFAKAIQVHLTIPNNTPTAFYDRYFWGNIVLRSLKFLNDNE